MAGKISKYDEMACKYGDPWIWGIYLVLIVLSMVVSYTASSREVAVAGVYMPIVKQALFLGIGACIVWCMYRVDYNNKVMMTVMIGLLTVVTLASLVALQFGGQDINGAKRAISLGFFGFQPAELAKLSIVTILAWLYSKTQMQRDVSWVGLLWSCVLIGAYSGFLIQGGLTNTLLFFSISFTMMIICGTKMKKIFVVFGVALVMGGGLLMVSHLGDEKEKNLAESSTQVEVEASKDSGSFGRSDTWHSRIDDWVNDLDSLVYRPITNKNQQKMFSRIAQAHGGMTGVGIGKSRECSRLPLAFSDYIYSIVVEETGFVGGVLVIVLYLWLLSRALMIVLKQSHRVLPSLLIIGVACMVVYQALFHMAINVGVFPVSGQPLPMISKGGTSILVTSAAFGIMLSVSRTLARQNSNYTITEKERAAEQQSAEQKVNESLKNEWK